MTGYPFSRNRPAPAQIRVSLAPGFGPIAADDLHGLLRRRLLILTSIVAGALFVGLGVDISSQLRPLQDHLDQSNSPLEWLGSTWPLLALLTVTGVSAAVLWRHPPRPVRGLRMIELLVIGGLATATIALSLRPMAYDVLEQAAQQPLPIRRAFVGNYIHACALLWFINLTLYGAFIPNTWRRCTVVVGVVATSPLVLFAVYGYWLRPIDPRIVGKVLNGLGFFNALAAVIAVFASSRIEILRRQAAEARKLGQYVLQERLGGGGMGEVFRAQHVLLRRPCALKLIRPERAGDEKNLRRFEREVQLTATLTHPNTIQIFDYGRADDGTFYYVMEYLPGLTLDELVKQHGPLTPGRAIHFLRQICAALREAHTRGLIHRDIKPGNVMICERGGVGDVAKLLDFGLVLPPADDPDGEKLTQDGSVAGTPAYLSPEQAGGCETLDARSDIYSVGALAYYLLTGQPPFANRSAVKMLAAHLYEKPPALSDRCPHIPTDLEAIVLCCLAKRPVDRFPDAESLDLALAACGAAGQWNAQDAAREWRTNPLNVTTTPPSLMPVSNKS